MPSKNQAKKVLAYVHSFHSGKTRKQKIKNKLAEVKLKNVCRENIYNNIFAIFPIKMIYMFLQVLRILQ